MTQQNIVFLLQHMYLLALCSLTHSQIELKLINLSTKNPLKTQLPAEETDVSSQRHQAWCLESSSVCMLSRLLFDVFHRRAAPQTVNTVAERLCLCVCTWECLHKCRPFDLQPVFCCFLNMLCYQRFLYASCLPQCTAVVITPHKR